MAHVRCLRTAVRLIVTRSRIRASRVALLFALVGIAVPGVAAQVPLARSRPPSQQLQFRQLTPDNGLSSTWVKSITQDSRGFMWLGTQKGLNRYDGASVAVYRHRASDTTSLGDSEVEGLYADEQKTLWVGTAAGLSRYDPARDAFVNYPIVRGQQVAVSSIMEVRGTLWLGTTRGLYQFDRATGTATLYRNSVSGVPLVKGEVVVLAADRARHLWIGTIDEGLRELDPLTGRVRSWTHNMTAPASPTSLPSNEVLSIVQDFAGAMWLGMGRPGGLVQLDYTTGVVTRTQHEAANPQSLAVNTVRMLLLDGARGLWVGTENGGLDYLDFATLHFQHNQFDPNNPTGLNNDSIYALYADAVGTLWVGTYAGGVNIVRQNGDAIRRYRTTAGDATSLSSNSVFRFWEDRHGIMWVVTDGGGLNRFDPATGKFMRYNSHTSNLNFDAVIAIAEDHAGKLWVGNIGGGINRFDPETGRFTPFTTKNSGLIEDRVFSLLVDRAGALWIGTESMGLQRFDLEHGTFTAFKVGRTSESRIRTITEASDGTLLLSTLTDGLVVLDPRTGTRTRYEAGPSGLSSNQVQAVLESEPGIVWVGTSTALDRINRRTNTIDHFTDADGLPSGGVAGLALDAAHHLWVSGDRGIIEYDPTTKSGRALTIADGLQGNLFNVGASYRSHDGTLYFGGDQGFNAIHPERVTRNSHLPPVALTGFQLFNKPVTIGAEGSPLQTSIVVARELVLRHEQSVFTLEFAALDFAAPEKNQYAYKLEGLNKDWNEVGTTRTATYTNLPVGHYVFHVKASNNDGAWNEQGATIGLTILPPFWATWWFRTLVLLAACAVLYLQLQAAHGRRLVVALAAEHDRQSQQYLERNVLEILGAMQRFRGGDHTVALDVVSEDAIGKLRLGFNSVVADRQRAEEELRQSQKMEAVGRLAGGVAHDFNNLLTVIKGNTDLALADPGSPKAVREELEEIERAANRASSLTRQLLAFSRKQLLKPRTLVLNALIADLGRILRRTVGEDIALTITLDPALGSVRADPGQIEQVVLNLVVNARDALPLGGTLSIETRNVAAEEVRDHPEAEDIAYVAITVTDNGTGMTPEVLNRIFEPFFTTKEQGKGTGLGLSTVYGSVKQSGGFVVVKSALGMGCAFSVFLPRVAAVEEPQLIHDTEVAQPGSATVLLVEDEDAVRRLVSRVLTKAGYAVLTAPCGEVALDVARDHTGPIDLLLTDVVMPGMSGGELAKQLMPLRPEMRLLYASGYTEDAMVRHGVSSAQTTLLEKPFTPEALLRSVREVLRRAQSEMETAVALPGAKEFGD
ncbi:MAG: two-component regulator propeller domain-containing protein [bacterium]